MSQCDQILSYLRKYPRAGITTWIAFQRFGCTRLARVIHSLRKKHDIPSEMRKLRDGRRIAVYRLAR